MTRPSSCRYQLLDILNAIKYKWLVGDAPFCSHTAAIRWRSGDWLEALMCEMWRFVVSVRMGEVCISEGGALLYTLGLYLLQSADQWHGRCGCANIKTTPISSQSTLVAMTPCFVTLSYCETCHGCRRPVAGQVVDACDEIEHAVCIDQRCLHHAKSGPLYQSVCNSSKRVFTIVIYGSVAYEHKRLILFSLKKLMDAFEHGHALHQPV